MSEPLAHRRAERLFLASAFALLTCWGLAQIFYGERIPAGDGQGWDGRFYTWLIRDFRGVLLGGQFDSYRLQRVLPSAVVRAALAIGGLPTEDRHIVRAFAFLNLAALLGTLLAWNGIARALCISIAGRWLGFLLLFVNFACLKTSFYIPEMTDHAALFLGALLLYGHVRQSGLLMGAALLLGAFTWPSLLALGGLLFVFRPGPLPDVLEPLRGRHWLAGGAFVALFLLGLALHLRNPVPYWGLGETTRLDRRLLPISVPLAAGFIFLAFGFLSRQVGLFRWNTYWRSFDGRRFGMWCLMALVAGGAIAALSSGAPPPQTFLNFLRYQAVQPVMLPGLALLSHVVYLGLLPLVLIFYWPRACGAAHRIGLGLTLFSAAVLAQSLTAVSRQLLHGLTTGVLLAVLAVEHIRWPRWAPWMLGGLAFFGSKAWFAINHEGFMAKSHFLSYPAQYYFMNFGLWMSREMYAVQGALALVAALLLALLFLRGRKLTAEERDLVRPRTQTLTRLWACVAGIAAAMLLVEGGARHVLDRRRAPAGADTLLWQPDPNLGWSNRPGSQALVHVAGRGIPLQFNSHGLRGPEYDYAKPAGRRRLLLLGGSAAEAYSVAESRSLRALFETHLNAQGCGRYEVINGGVARYGTLQQARFFAIEGARYAPDVVIVLFNIEDMTDLVRDSDSEAEEPIATPAPSSGMRQQLRTARALPLYPWRGSAALRLLSNFTLERAPALHRLLASANLVERTKPPRALWPLGAREEGSVARRTTQRLLSALAEDVRSRGADIGVVYAPARFEVDARAWEELLMRYRMSPRFWRRDRVVRSIEANAAETGVPFLDLREAFARSDRRLAQLYFAREGLWTEAGHALVSEVVATWFAASFGCAKQLAPLQRREKSQ